MSDSTNQHGAFSWNELMTSDVEGAKAFYGELFNWTLEEAPMNKQYTIAKLGEQMASGIMETPPEAAGMPPMWGSYVTVENLDDAAKKVEQLGGKIIIPLTDIPQVGRFCVIQDPQGATLSIITYSNECQE